jgi:hypothetical protein
LIALRRVVLNKIRLLALAGGTALQAAEKLDFVSVNDFSRAVNPGSHADSLAPEGS